MRAFLSCRVDDVRLFSLPAGRRRGHHGPGPRQTRGPAPRHRVQRTSIGPTARPRTIRRRVGSCRCSTRGAVHQAGRSHAPAMEDGVRTAVGRGAALRQVEVSWPADAKNRPAPDELTLAYFHRADDAAHTGGFQESGQAPATRIQQGSGGGQAQGVGRRATDVCTLPVDTWGVVAVPGTEGRLGRGLRPSAAGARRVEETGPRNRVGVRGCDRRPELRRRIEPMTGFSAGGDRWPATGARA